METRGGVVGSLGECGSSCWSDVTRAVVTAGGAKMAPSLPSLVPPTGGQTGPWPGPTHPGFQLRWSSVHPIGGGPAVAHRKWGRAVMTRKAQPGKGASLGLLRGLVPP